MVNAHTEWYTDAYTARAHLRDVEDDAFECCWGPVERAI